ncbi:MAG: PD-(D/E)XK nuclease family protein [Coriobacteriia bacterium]|nr:PD-(D/E)XK nuclease family protein [Coriobacteriia bacterium]
MSVRVITGSANSGKTGVAYGRVREVVRAGGRALILVPSAPDALRVAEEFAHECPIGLATGTLGSFLDDHWYARGDGRSLVTSAERLILIEEAVRICQASSYDPRLATCGVTGVLDRLCQREAESHGAPMPPRETGSVAAMLVRVVCAYEGLLSAVGMVERAEANRIVIDSLKPSHVPDVLVVNRVMGLTAAQERFVVCASRMTEVMVCVTYDSAVPSTVAAAGLVARLAREGTVDHQPSPGTFTAPGELAAIERYLGGPARLAAVSDGAVFISQAWGDGAESARIVREVQDAIGDGIAPGRIAIVFRDPSDYVAPLGAALLEAGIEAEWDGRVPFARSGLGRALLVALRFSAGEHVERMDLLRTPYSPASHQALDALDARIRSSGAVAAHRFEDLAGHIEPATGLFIREVRRACDSVGSADSRQRWHRLVAGMLGRAWKGEACGDGQALLDIGASRVFAEAIDAAALLGESGIKASGIGAALAEATITVTAHEDPHRVQIMAAERARGRRYDCVIVGGLNAGVFPRTSRDDVLTAPAVAAELGSAGIDVAPRGGVEQERLLFYLVATRASRRLVLSTQSHDAEGRVRQPSTFLEEVLDLYRHEAPDEEPDSMPPYRVLEAEGIAGHREAPFTRRRALRAVAGGAVDGCEPGDLQRIARARDRACRAAGELGVPTREALAAREVFSATEIESYLNCPYRWYVERVVRPRELDVRIDAAAAGALAHAIMRDFYNEFIVHTGEPRLTPALLAGAREIHTRVAGAAAEGIRAVSAAEEIQVRATIRQTWQMLAADAVLLPGLAPAYREWAFGMEDEPEPFDGFLLKGRIDRIDTDDRSLVVTDYKLGGIDHTRAHARFADEGLVQLPLYAAVAARRLGLTVAGGVYRSMNGGKPRGFIDTALVDGSFVRNDAVDEAAARQVVADAVERAAEAVADMRAGRITPAPPERGCPAYCSARAFCADWRPAHART